MLSFIVERAPAPSVICLANHTVLAIRVLKWRDDIPPHEILLDLHILSGILWGAK
jgi:hypothetical protein